VGPLLISQPDGQLAPSLRQEQPELKDITSFPHCCHHLTSPEDEGEDQPDKHKSETQAVN